MSLFVASIHFLLLSIIIYQLKQKYKSQPLVRWWYAAIFVKLLFGVFYGLIYLKIYGGGGDSFLYYKEVSVLVNLAYTDFAEYWNIFWYNQYNPYINISIDAWRQERVLATIKFLSILQIFTFNDYWLQSFYLSFLSAWGIWKLANTLVKIFPSAYFSAIFAFLLFPSVQLWSSGYTKESITMFFLCFSLSYFLEAYFNYAKISNKWYYLKIFLLFFATIIWLYLVKFYYLAALLPTIFAFIIVDFIVKKIKIKYHFLKIVLFLLVWFSLVIPITQLHSALKIDYFLLALVYNHNTTYIASHPNDLIHYSIYPVQGYITLEGYSLYSFLYNAPTAFFSACFRPFLWETYGQKLKILMALENTFFLFSVLIGTFCAFRIKIKSNHSHYFLVLALLWYSIILLTILAFASPNLGSLMRYRIAVYPFLLYLFLGWIETYIIEFRLEIKNKLKIK